MNKQEYLLTCLAEEAAEIIQEVGKAQRFGLDDIYNQYSETPRKRLHKEFIDLVTVMDMLLENEAVEDFISYSGEQMLAKRKKIEIYMEYSENKGTLK